MTEMPLNRRETWRFDRIRESDPDFDPTKAARRSQVALLFELAYRQHLDGAVSFPRDLAAALLNRPARSLVIAKRPETGHRPFVDGLQDHRGYMLDDPGRLLDLAGVDPKAGWSDEHRPRLLFVDPDPKDDVDEDDEL